ncbi:MAG: DUF6261 family protein [Prevotellaceae bacterium]|jgi:hypothetical protein|nr:DUF6261 family protein [Prevotellaceae bacterium]
MRKIIKLAVSRLTRGAYFNFMMSIYTLAMSNKLVAQKAAKFLAALKLGIDHVDGALAIQRKSAFTEQISILNNRRHSLLTVLKGTARGFLKLDSTQEDAKTLLQLLKDYSIRRNMQIDAATGLFSNLIDDLEGKFAPAVKTLNLQQVVVDIKAANTELQQVVKERLDETTNNGTSRLIDARKETDKAYREFTEVVETLDMMDGGDTYADFIDHINVLIKHYKQEALGDKVKEKIPGGNNNDGGNDDGEEEPPQG